MNAEEAWGQLLAVAHLPEDEIVLDRFALALAATEYPNLDIGQELASMDSLAAGAARRLGDRRDPLFCLNALSDFLFDEIGFRGNEEEYYDPRNSYLNEVLARRLGIPITLSLVYVETGRRLGVPLSGIGLPGHLVVGHRELDGHFVDPFNGGILLTEQECAQRIEQVNWGQVPWDPRYLAPLSNKALIARMVRNLKGAYLGRNDYVKALRMIDWLLEAQPQVSVELRDRGIVKYRMGDYPMALQDLERYLASTEPAGDSEAVRTLIARIQARIAR